MDRGLASSADGDIDRHATNFNLQIKLAMLASIPVGILAALSFHQSLIRGFMGIVPLIFLGLWILLMRTKREEAKASPTK